MERRIVVTQRDCPARLVPVGTPITIAKDTFVTITQALGGSYTVTVNGNMARVDGTDADALGMEALELRFAEHPGDGISEEQVYQALETVYDPEIPVNIVNLGLIYSVAIDQATATVSIRMTLTAPGCGMGPVLVGDVEYRVAKVPNVRHVAVDLVFDPPWSREMMSDEARLETGMFY
ncbi:MAG: putative Fe-S cluster assembly protein SufT [Gammaproteobacteria bacterium]|jgi:probable FeS assembly SUF system protein SufT|nr:putative Fe-S cluster assembly protein SufT [Gammaproteobacteria bacterium]MBP6050574.1 putative Fe-S cluster assembly protein SufT [Pseudomonadales bacterium]MBK6583421.1 putative Fe-S cluster assembly protein SufT [Gammaproteobacteria bacterium]MBK7521115.1 putative Fe-S cluster assembly protein SufT [Gammaproteobacteria bacterium]MBK7728889.1 putative Fe-S cluster assembly protein SufT [Gammaproteobacteria bacterium]